ncbi:MAG: alpha/beta hydrolase [Rhodospirillales bacterium]|nr:alpha/beta hydrolase [Rhodospirillales bacterium]
MNTETATADDNAPDTQAPQWFRDALSAPREDRYVDVDGCRIHYLLWSDDDTKPGMILVHGMGAHANWWSFIAPFFTDHYRVAALDLGGFGDSEYRENYSADRFVSELTSVGADAGFGDDTLIVGHSFGGFVTLQAAIEHGDKLGGVVLVDSPVRPPDYDWEKRPHTSPIRPKRIYPDRETAIDRFRLRPPQECANGFIMEYIAQHSIRQVEGGWEWKFDDQLFKTFKRNSLSTDLASIPCRMAVILGEESKLFSQDIADYMFKTLDSSVPFVTIPEAEHHIWLDQPLAFISSLRTLLAEWRHSRPQRGDRHL